MSRFQSLPALALLGASVWVLSGIATDNCAAKASDQPESVDQLIEQLGDSQFGIREMATRKLAARDDALMAVRRALQSSDPEVRRRAERIIEELLTRKDRRSFQQMLTHGRNGEIDQFVERFIVRKDSHR
jgi:hypothetical protein